MQLKSKAEIGEAIVAACKAANCGVAAGPGPIETVALVCGPYAAVYSGVNAIPIAALITLALQLIPIIFGDGGFTIEKLTAILTFIQSIFV
jgi:hypothetical protein